MSPITSIRRDVCPFWYLLIVCLVGLPGPASAQTAVNGTLLISEFRVRGPNGANDEFVEIYNNTNASHTVSSLSGTGYGLAASDGVTRCSIPNGTVIPARGHYLCIEFRRILARVVPRGQRRHRDGERDVHDRHSRQRRHRALQQQHGRRQLLARESHRRRRIHLRSEHTLQGGDGLPGDKPVVEHRLFVHPQVDGRMHWGCAGRCSSVA